MKKPLIAASAVLIATLSVPAQAIDVVFDYTYDSAGFFTSDKRVVLDQVAQVFSLNLLDTLTAITPSGGNAFTARLYNPQDPFGTPLKIDPAASCIAIATFARGKPHAGGHGGT